jgi:hypothetical protein
MQSIENSAAIQQPIPHHISDKLNFQQQLRNWFVEQTSLHPLLRSHPTNTASPYFRCDSANQSYMEPLPVKM